MQTGSQSSGFSLEIASFISNTLSFIGINTEAEMIHAFIRMCGHVFQYSIFGYLTCWMISIFDLKWYNMFRTLYIMIIDEGIQYITPGRAAEFIDIVLDSLGVSLSLIIFYMTKRLFSKKHGG